jgi:hypothetical protein
MLLSMATGFVVANPSRGASEAVESASRGLSAEFPWYDAQRDALRRVDLPPIEGAVPTRLDWRWSPTNWNLNLNLLWDLIEALAWLLLIVLLGLIIHLLVKAYLNRESLAVAGPNLAAQEQLTDAQRIEQLPFQVRRPESDLLSAAREAYQAGNFGDAIVYLFSYQLLQLDKVNLIRLAKGKTNRQYLRELRHQGTARRLLTHSMLVFEDVFFGNYRLDRERFESCWNELEQFQSVIRHQLSHEG